MTRCAVLRMACCECQCFYTSQHSPSRHFNVTIPSFPKKKDLIKNKQGGQNTPIRTNHRDRGRDKDTHNCTTHTHGWIKIQRALMVSELCESSDSGDRLINLFDEMWICSQLTLCNYVSSPYFV